VEEVVKLRQGGFY